MTRRHLPRKYARLRPHERALTALAAAARMDSVELERLRLPEGSAAEANTETAQRFIACQTIAMGWALLWEDPYREYLLLSVMDAAQRESLGFKVGDGVAFQLVRELAALFLGLAWFCESIDCEAQTLLKALWPPLASRVLEFVEMVPFAFLDAAGEPDEVQAATLERAAEVEGMLALGWPFERRAPSPYLDTDDVEDDDGEDEETETPEPEASPVPLP